MTAAAVRVPPRAVEAEEALLGAILAHNEAHASVSGWLRPEHFADPLHARVYEIIDAALAEGRRADPRLVLASLTVEAGKEGEVRSYLAHLVADAVTVDGAPSYGRVVLDRALRRGILAIADDLANMAADPAWSAPPAILSEAIGRLDQLSQDAADGSLRALTLGEASRDAIGAALTARATGRRLMGASWGLPSLDRMTLGLCRGDLIVPAGRPGIGKTTFGLAVGLKAARAGHGVYIASLEMTGAQLALRALAAEASRTGPPLLYEHVARGEIDDAEARRLEAAGQRHAEMPIVIEQEPGLSVSQIASRARMHRRRFEKAGTRIDLVVIDHLGLLRPPAARAGNKVAETEDVSGALKRLAKELDCCVMALCQLSRAVEGRDDKRPTLADLRWSGAIEQDADMVIGLFREEYYLRRLAHASAEQLARLNDVQNVMEVEILKQRMGRVGRVELFCHAGANVIDEKAVRQ